jgi:transcriptional regulator with XRE-family HTH domain
MDLSQEEFAKAVGVSKAALAAYEDGEGYTPGADKVMAICRFTGKSPNELMGWKEAV